MKSMKKWLLMLMTALSVVTFAAGCSNDDTKSDTGTEENSDEQSNTSEDSSQE